MARAGADLVGVNCLFDPNILLDVMSEMKAALDQENLHPYLMVQPLGNIFWIKSNFFGSLEWNINSSDRLKF